MTAWDCGVCGTTFWADETVGQIPPFLVDDSGLLIEFVHVVCAKCENCGQVVIEYEVRRGAL